MPPLRVAKLILHYVTDELTRASLARVPDALVVDNGSPRPFPGAHLRQEDLGFTRGWNRAIESVYADHDAFMLMNSDVLLDARDIEQLREVMERDPQIGLLSGACNSPHPTMRRPWRRKLGIGPRGQVRDVPFVELVAPLVSRRLFDTIGLLDPAFSLGYGVDYDLGFRAWHAGFRVAVLDDVHFRHLGHATIRQVTDLHAYRTMALAEMRAHLLEKYGPDFFDPAVYPFWDIGGAGPPRFETRSASSCRRPRT